MAPHEESNDGNSKARECHEGITENAFAGDTGYHLTNHAHSGKNHDVDSRMGVEPEQMLEQYRIATQIRIKNSQMQSAFKNHQKQCDGNHWRRQDLDQTRGIVRPNEQW